MSKPIEVGDLVYCPGVFYGSMTIESADASANTLTSTAHGFTDGMQTQVRVTGGVLPGGLAEDTFYYVVSATTDTLKLATTPGGTAIDLTTPGSGFMQLFGLMDPTTVALTIEDPSGTETSYTYAGATITKAIVGVYYKLYPSTREGIHKVRYVTTGNPAVVHQYTFYVSPSNV